MRYYGYRIFLVCYWGSKTWSLLWIRPSVASTVYLFLSQNYMNKARKKRLEDNKEKRNTQARAWRKANPDKVRAIKKRHYVKNKEKILKDQRKYMKEWRRKNPDKCKAYAKKWRDKNAVQVSLAREQYYLSIHSSISCPDHPSNPEIRELPMNAHLQNPTETFDFSIVWLRDLSQNAQTINE